MKTLERLSNCCGYSELGNTGLCVKCKEHADFYTQCPDCENEVCDEDMGESECINCSRNKS